MTANEHEGEEPTGGVFGNLPRERPVIRSPRRRATDDEEKTSPSAGKAKTARASARAARASAAAPRHSARPTPPPPPRRPAEQPASPRAEPEEPAQGQIAGLEDLAWAGITVCAEAATLGVRFASRALEAVREAMERR